MEHQMHNVDPKKHLMQEEEITNARVLQISGSYANNS